MIEAWEASNSVRLTGCGPQPRLCSAQRIKVHQHVLAGLLGQEGHGGPPRDDGQQVVPPPADPPRVALDQLLQGDGHLLLDGDGPVHVARDAEQLGPRVVLPAEGREPLGPAAQDGRGHGHRLDVGHRGRAAVQPDVGREGRLEARLALLALERLDEGRLLAADVGPRAVVDVQVEGDPGPADVLSEESHRVRLADGPLHGLALVDELAPNVDVPRAGPHAHPRDHGPLDQLVGLVPHDLAVLARAGLGLVGVDHDVVGAAVGDLGGGWRVGIGAKEGG